MDIPNYIKTVFQIKSESEFNELAIQLFHYQNTHNPIYKQYIKLIGCKSNAVKNYHDIPFLPIELFRTKKIITQNSQNEPSKNKQAVFTSSGTTSKNRSKHYILDIELYKKSIIEGFKLFIGAPEEYAFLCLVPEVQTYPDSSLAFMCAELIQHSDHPKSDFYLNKKELLKSVILDLQKKKQQFILFGLSFEILNFAEENKISLENGIVVETGGSKKNNQHIIREDLHNRLKLHFNNVHIYSEYGMAELLSQSYYTTNHCFETPPWKKILIRDKTNPLKIVNGKRGSINIIDLANVHSCGFIATNDFGQLNKTGFDVIGRNQNATARGCNLMI